MKTFAICSDDTQRRRDLRAHRDQGHTDLNGIDYIEVSETDQRVLHVHFMDRAPIVDQATNNFSEANVVISGGRRIRNMRVLQVRLCQPEDEEVPDCMEVEVDKAGDFSTYTLCLVEADGSGPLKGIDPRYACADFSFKANCPSDLDCQTVNTCPPPTLVEPEIDYLAKDYSSFRQLMLDRLALIMPDWQERHIPDFGITVVEILAYVGDYLSYYQDAVATEAYLETARQRISVHRHTRLVDYPMHEGCNARTWLFIETDSDLPPVPIKDIYFITGHNNALPFSKTTLQATDLQGIPASNYEVFEPLRLTEPLQENIQLYQSHNSISIYTWGEKECCWPRGTTSTTLRDCDPNWQPPSPAQAQTTQQQQGGTETPSTETPPRILHLQVGDVLIFEEVLGPKTGNSADADPTHRQAVRLTRVEQDTDPLYNIPVLEIAWGEEDKLLFPLCLSAIGPAPECTLLTDISIARGNIMLVDHGQTVGPETLEAPSVEPPVEQCEGEDDPADTTTLLAPYNPSLEQTPLTFSQPLPVDSPFFAPIITDPSIPVSLTSAASLLIQDPRQSVPWITLTSTPPTDGGTLYTGPFDDEDDDEREIENTDTSSQPVAPEKDTTIVWNVKRDLLESQSDDYDFVVEMDNDGDAHLRFGDGQLGHAVANGMQFTATYRIGHGLRGNVGANSITHIVFKNSLPSGVKLQPRNPIAVSGGTDPEPLAEVRLFAPHAFRTNKQRAITADDYAELAQRNPKVQRAAATLRWTGSWYEVLVAIDPFGTEEADQALLDQIEAYLEHYRRIGHDLKVVGAHYVPLDIVMTICVAPHYLSGHVKAALLDIFSNRVLPNGQLGFFHPDNLTFGVGIAVSKLVAIAQAVPGVQSVKVERLERLREGPNDELVNEFLPIGPMEIAQLDNDPSFPENGKLVFKMVGGR